MPEKPTPSTDPMEIAATMRTSTEDVLGSYTGTPDGKKYERPTQDVDDL